VKKYVSEVVAEQIVLLDKKTKATEEPQANDISEEQIPFKIQKERQMNNFQ